MNLTMEQVCRVLDPDELDYPAAAASLGPEAIPFLRRIVASDHPTLASKATYLASLIQSDQAISVLEEAVHSSSPAVRVAAAAGISNLAPSPRADTFLSALLMAPDAGVRKAALDSVAALRANQLRAVVESIAKSDRTPEIAAHARKVLSRLP
jgi:HEAT repeat protein